MLKSLANHSENRVYKQIQDVCDEFGAEIYRKIRIADAVEIGRLQERELGTYCLMSHFDFVVTDAKHLPLFVLEYDGPGHTGENDWKKDKICTQEDLAIFRVSVEALNAEVQQMSFLRYLVNVWFYAHEFERLRGEGQIPLDEPFVMGAFLKPNAKHIFDSDFEFTLSARSQISKLMKKAGLPIAESAMPRIGNITLSRGMENFASFASCPVGRSEIFGLSKLNIKVPCFGTLADVPFGPLALADFTDGQAHRALAANTELFFSGAAHTLLQKSEVLEEIAHLRRNGYTMLHGGGFQGHALEKALSDL